MFYSDEKYRHRKTTTTTDKKKQESAQKPNDNVSFVGVYVHDDFYDSVRINGLCKCSPYCNIEPGGDGVCACPGNDDADSL